MANSVIIAAAAILLAGLLVVEKKDRTGGKLAVKAPLSALFVAAAVVQPNPEPIYFRLLLAGLLLCLVGDICLVLDRRAAFLAGLVAFLVGHLAYTTAFVQLSGLRPPVYGALAAAAAAGAAVFFRLKPHLGSMKSPVAAYIVVISLMVCAAVATAADAGLSPAARRMIPAGALAFYLSDIFVARQRFVRKDFANRLFGLPLYYTGQFLLAFSVGVL
jgi:uncharacterized membrane protein YhhN